MSEQKFFATENLPWDVVQLWSRATFPENSYFPRRLIVNHYESDKNSNPSPGRQRNVL